MYKKDNITFEEIPFSLPALISSIKSSFENVANEKGIRLRVRRDIEVPDIVIGDPLRLTEVLNKLVSNALKFTEEGSVTMDISLNNVTPAQVYIDFSVEDTGIGIEDSQKEYIFTGSLSTTKQVLLLQDSDISFHSIPGTGSIFSFCLPFKTIEIPSVKSMTPDNFAGKKVLLAEDDAINRLIATKFMQNWLLKVDYAVTGKEAIAKVKKNNYDLILMDLQMPGLNGYEASQQIRATKITTPIIALTAYAVSEIKSKAIQAGMNDCLGKPFFPDALFKILSQYLIK